MSVIRLQGKAEKKKGIYFQLDSEDEPIGVGGMGQVFKGICVNERTGVTRPVAIKFMYDDLPPQAIERARREASIQLRNDNLVEMLGFIEIDETTALGEVKKHFHVVSELLTGVSLSDIFEGKTQDRDGEDVAYAVKLQQDFKNDPEHFAKIIVVNVLSGLMALHDAGYIHRDIDPSNIMVTTDGHIKLIDFGIAKQMNTLTTSDKALTVAGKFMGKPEYAAPELALGDIQHQNQTTDIYAMGILLYQCIIGHTPFEGARHEILEKQLKAKLPLDVIKNKDLRAIIARACEKKQELRFQTSSEMRVAIENPKAMKGGLTKQKKMMLAGIAAALVVILAVVGVVVKGKQEATKAQAEQALFEKQKTQFMADINAKISKADEDMEDGMDSERENYEQSLMTAVTAYQEVADAVSKDKTYKVKIDIDSHMQKAISALKKAQETFSNQAAEMKELGESEMSEGYAKRAKAVEDFLKGIGN